jgi:DNA segregation ATPase FtsK/SpoIIIE-like protein
VNRVAPLWLVGAPLVAAIAAALLCAIFLDWGEGVPPIILTAAGAAFLSASAWLLPFARAVGDAHSGRAALSGLGAVITAHAIHACTWAARQALSFGLSWSEAWLWQRKLQLWASVLTVPVGVGLAVLLARLLRPVEERG